MATVKPASEILAKLRVRPGLQLTTHVLTQHPLPYSYIDLFYDREKALFAVRLSWPTNSKTVYLKESDVISKSKSMWMADKTFRLTEDCITRLSPGLDNAIAAMMEKLKEKTC